MKRARVPARVHAGKSDCETRRRPRGGCGRLREWGADLLGRDERKHDREQASPALSPSNHRGDLPQALTGLHEKRSLIHRQVGEQRLQVADLPPNRGIPK